MDGSRKRLFLTEGKAGTIAFGMYVSKVFKIFSLFFLILSGIWPCTGHFISKFSKAVKFILNEKWYLGYGVDYPTGSWIQCFMEENLSGSLYWYCKQIKTKLHSPAVHRQSFFQASTSEMFLMWDCLNVTWKYNFSGNNCLGHVWDVRPGGCLGAKREILHL